MTIYVDPMDELTTIVHRIRTAPDPEIVLVVPPGNWALRNAINLKLLAKYAQDSQKQLAIKTSDPLVIMYAEANQIAVVGNGAEAEQENCGEAAADAGLDEAETGSFVEEAAAAKDDDDKSSGYRGRENRRGSSKKAGYERLFVVLLVLAAMLGLAYCHLPKAIIVVSPKLIDFSETIELPLAQLEGAELVAVQTTLTRRTPATGRKTVGITAARGVVTLINQSQSEVLVKKGSIVETGNGVKFQTASDVVVPAVQTQYFMDIPTGLIAGKAEVEIIAVEPGIRGNVAAGRINSIQGYNLEVRNLEPTTGGEDVVLQVAAEEDLERAKAMVSRDSAQELLESIKARLDGRVLLEDTFQSEIQWVNMSQAGEETSEVFASAVCLGKAFLIDTERIGEEVARALAAKVPEGFAIDPGTVELVEVRLAAGESEFRLRVQAQAVIKGIINPSELADQLAGKDAAEFQEVVAANPAIARIHIENGAADKLPALPRWLKVKIEEPVY